MENKQGITGRGKAWEILNSWWIALAFVSMAWVGFFYIGIKAKQKKWIAYAVILTFCQLFSLFFVGSGSDDSVATNFWVAIWAAAYFVGIILSFIVRKKFLICLDVLKSNNSDYYDNQKIRNEVASEYREQGLNVGNARNTNSNPYVNSQNKPVVNNPLATNESSVKQNDTLAAFGNNEPTKTYSDRVIDINSCSEMDFMNLPGFDAQSAKNAAQYRTEHKGFVSTDEFLAITQVKPHLIENVKKLIRCGSFSGETKQLQNDTVQNKTEEPKIQGGRKLDF